MKSMLSLAQAETSESLVERLSRLNADSPRLWGHMTASQMLCHLNDSFLLSLGERNARSMENLFSRTLVKYVALRTPMRWPRNLPTMPEMKQGGGTCPTTFLQDREGLVRTMRRFCVPDPAVGNHRHPMFGLMSLSDWLRWGYLHCDHHFRQFGV